MSIKKTHIEEKLVQDIDFSLPPISSDLAGHEPLQLSGMLRKHSESDKTKKIAALVKKLKQNLPNKRAYKQFQQAQNIDIVVQSKINWKNLKFRLQNPLDTINPLTEEMRKFLAEKLYTAIPAQQPILTPEEKIFFKRLLSFENGKWELKHATRDYGIIRENNEELLSLKERERRGQDIQNRHTNEVDGNTDNVFLSIAPGKSSTVRFLDQPGNTLITFDYSRELQRGTNTFDGLWSSGHMFAFRTKQDANPLNICGTHYIVQYRQHIDPNNGKIVELKNCIFKHPTGEKFTQVLTKADEIFLHPRIDIALVLMTIEKIRLLGKDAWQHLMDPTLNLTVLQTAVHNIFHSGMFEVHKPAGLFVNPVINPNINIESIPASIPWKQEKIDLHIDLIKACLKNETEAVMQAIQKDNTLDINSSFLTNSFSTFVNRLSIFGAAILSGDLNLIKALLPKATLLGSCAHMGNKDIKPLTLVIISSDSVHMQKHNLKSHAENTSIAIMKLLAQGSIKADCPFIGHLPILGNEEINDAFRFAKPTLEMMIQAFTYFSTREKIDVNINALIFKALENDNIQLLRFATYLNPTIFSDKFFENSSTLPKKIGPQSCDFLWLYLKEYPITLALLNCMYSNIEEPTKQENMHFIDAFEESLQRFDEKFFHVEKERFDSKYNLVDPEIKRILDAFSEGMEHLLVNDHVKCAKRLLNLNPFSNHNESINAFFYVLMERVSAHDQDFETLRF